MTSQLPVRHSRYPVGTRMTRPLTLLLVGEVSEVNSQCDSFCLVFSAGRSLSAESASSECEVSCVLRILSKTHNKKHFLYTHNLILLHYNLQHSTQLNNSLRKTDRGKVHYQTITQFLVGVKLSSIIKVIK